MGVNVNKVFIAGNLTRKPELKHTKTGKAVCSFSVAVNDFKDKVTFVRVNAWDKTAENCEKFLEKGSPVLVEGRLQSDTFEFEGKNRTVLNVVANMVHFLSGGNNNSHGSSSGSEEDIPF